MHQAGTGRHQELRTHQHVLQQAGHGGGPGGHSKTRVPCEEAEATEPFSFYTLMEEIRPMMVRVIPWDGPR